MASKTQGNNSLKAAKFILHLLINIVFYLIVIYMIASAGTKLYNISYQIFGNKGVAAENARDVQITISKGEATMNVARKLEQQKVIDNRYSFYLNAKLKERTVMPGTYIISTSMNYDEIFAVITVPSADEEEVTQEVEDRPAKEEEAEDTEDTEDADLSQEPEDGDNP